MTQLEFLREQLAELNLQVQGLIGPKVSIQQACGSDTPQTAPLEAPLKHQSQALELYFTGDGGSIPNYLQDLRLYMLKQYPHLKSVSTVYDVSSNRAALAVTPADLLTNGELSTILSKANTLDLVYLGCTADRWPVLREYQKQQFLGISYSTLVEGLKKKYDPNNILRKDCI